MENENRSKLRVILTSAVFLLVVFGLFAANLIYKTPELSYSERRKLSQYKAPTWSTVFDKSFMKYFDDKYAPDSFVDRDAWRSLKSFTEFNVFLLKDSNDIYITHGHAVKIEQMNENSITGAGQKIEKLTLSLPDGMNVFWSVIPDKGYFLGEANGYPHMDYDKLLSLLDGKINSAEYIDLFSALTVDDYYTTDLHWDQSKISDAVNALADAMGFSDRLGNRHTEHKLSPFSGVYSGQTALPLPADTLTYLTGDDTEKAIVQMLDTKTMQMVDAEMYDLEAFDGIDPYDVFLSGAQALVTIENPDAETDRQLYIFRDSYSSSLAPLLTSAYSKITLIDLRYIASPMLSQFVEFETGSDVLFLYGTSILNNSETLLVS